MNAAPGIRNVLETCLYVADMERSCRFYSSVLGLKPLFEQARITGFRIGDTMLLLFLQKGTLAPVETPGGVIPPHDGSGPAHFALSIPSGSEKTWSAWLQARGVPVESSVRWVRDNAVSLYFRDPDGHLVELATPGLWGIE